MRAVEESMVVRRSMGMGTEACCQRRIGVEHKSRMQLPELGCRHVLGAACPLFFGVTSACVGMFEKLRKRQAINAKT